AVAAICIGGANHRDWAPSCVSLMFTHLSACHATAALPVPWGIIAPVSGSRVWSTPGSDPLGAALLDTHTIGCLRRLPYRLQAGVPPHCPTEWNGPRVTGIRSLRSSLGFPSHP